MAPSVPSNPDDFRWALSSACGELNRLVAVLTDLLEEAARSPLDLNVELAEADKLQGPVQRLVYLMSSLSSRQEAAVAREQGATTTRRAPRTLVPTSEPARPARRGMSGLGVGKPPSLQGSSDSMPLPALFESLAASRKTGCLHLETGAGPLQFDFVEGELVCGTPRDAPGLKRLCDVLVRTGQVRAAELPRFLRGHAGSSVPVGDALVSWQLLTREQLLSALATLIRAEYTRALTADQWSYAFLQGAIPANGTRVRIPVRRLLLECSRPTDPARPA